jgi:hypothetical protein
MDEFKPPLPSRVDYVVDRRSVSAMLGEVMREVGVLLFVFIPLDLTLQGHKLTTAWIAAIVLLPVSFLATGIYVERTRRQ